MVPVAPGVLVRQRGGRPVRGPGQHTTCPPSCVRSPRACCSAEATHEPGYYDVVHSHYWLSGQVGWLARDRWAVPLVHTAHTLAAVKNAALAAGDSPEPPLRAVGEQQVVDEADRLIVNTEHEAQQLVSICIMPIRGGSMWCIRGSTWMPSRRGSRRRPSDPGDRARRAGGRVRGPDPAAQGARRAVARRRETARGAGAGRRRTLRQRPGRARHPDSAGRRAGYHRPRDVPAPAVPWKSWSTCTAPPIWSPCPVTRILRPGRHRGPGLRYPGGGSRGRRSAGRGGRRCQRSARRRPRRRRLGRRDRQRAAARSGSAERGRHGPRRAVLLGAHRRCPC